MIRIEVHRHRV